MTDWTSTQIMNYVYVGSGFLLVLSLFGIFCILSYLKETWIYYRPENVKRRKGVEELQREWELLDWHLKREKPND